MYSEKRGIQESTKKITAIVLVAVFVVSLVFAAGCGGDKGIVGKWTVVDAGESDEFPPGLIMNFQKNGELKFEVSDDASQDAQLVIAFMSLAKMSYKVKGDTIELTMDMMGEKETMASKFKIDGDTLTITDEEGGSVALKRAKQQVLQLRLQ